MVDTTGSMMCPTGPDGARCSMPPSPPVTGATRWSEVKKALDAFVQSSANAGIGVGVGFFPRAATDDGDQPGAVACKASDYVSPAREIALLPGAADDIVASIDSQEPSGSTPTLASLQGAIQYATTRAAADPDRRIAIVYATDGIPQGCDASNTIANSAIAARQAATFSPGVVTYVLGVGPKLNSLDEIAAAGGTGQAYLVDSANVADDLANALANIRTRSLACDYHIPQAKSGTLDYGLVNVEVQVGTSGSPGLVNQVADRSKCGAKGAGTTTTPASPRSSRSAPPVATRCWPHRGAIFRF